MAEKSLAQTTLKGFSWLFGSSMGRIVAKIGILAVLARFLSPSEFGLIGAATIVVNFAKLFTEMGFGPALVQRQELKNIHVHTAFASSMILAVLFYISLYFLAPIIADFFNMPPLTKILRVLGLIFIVEGVAVVSQSMVQRHLFFKWMAMSELATYVIGYGIVGVLMAYLEFGIWALVSALMTQSIVKTILYLAKSPVSFKLQFDKSAFHDLWYFSGGFTLSKIGNYLANVGDNIVAGRYLGDAALGFYSRAYSLMVAPTQPLGSALDKVMFPVMASIQEDKNRLAKAYFHGVGIFAILALPIGIYFFHFTREIVLVLLGSEWLEVVLPLKIMSCGLIFRLGYKISGSLTKAIGVVYQRAIRQWLYAVMIIVFAWVGQFWGIEGVAVGTLVAVTVNYFIMGSLCLVNLGKGWTTYFQKHYLGIIIGMICYFFLYYLHVFLDTWNIGSLMVLLLSGICYLIVYLFLIWLSHYLKLSKDLSWFIALLMQKTRRNKTSNTNVN